jgi:hypothetical protein
MHTHGAVVIAVVMTVAVVLMIAVFGLGSRGGGAMSRAHAERIGRHGEEGLRRAKARHDESA